MKIYAVITLATKGGHVSGMALSVWAGSAEEAEGKGLKHARKEWPQSGEWSNHSASAAEVPDEWIRLAAQRLQPPKEPSE